MSQDPWNVELFIGGRRVSRLKYTSFPSVVTRSWAKTPEGDTTSVQAVLLGGDYLLITGSSSFTVIAKRGRVSSESYPAGRILVSSGGRVLRSRAIPVYYQVTEFDLIVHPHNALEVVMLHGGGKSSIGEEVRIITVGGDTLIFDYPPIGSKH